LNIVFPVVFRYLGGTMGGFIVNMVIVSVFINHPHVERHFTGIIRGYQHFCLLFAVRQFTPAQKFTISRSGKFD
jgi:hypothetical protein